jgi:hypothetical protein
MKIAILFVVLLALACAQDGCKVFSCGTISQTEGEPEKCVSIQSGDASTTYDTATCSKEGEFCQAWEWDQVSQVAESAVCGTTSFETSWPTQFVAAAGEGLDGDICGATADCYTSALNTATCVSSVCASSIGAGETCAITNDCPVSHYCSTGDSPVCTVHTDDNAACTTVDECGFRRTCIEKVTDGTAAAATCVAWGTLANGDEFTQTVTGASSGLNAAVLGTSQVCNSGLQTNIDNTNQCRSANKNKVQGRDNLKKDNAGESCVTQQYTADALVDWDTPVEANTLSVCGFNTDNKAWCPLLAGDDEVVNFVSDFTTVWNTIKCHKNTGASGVGSVCKTQFDAEGSDDGWKVYQYLVQTSGDISFANTAMNDKCTAETIMSNFWQGQFDSAYTVSAITTMFVFIASFIY